MQVKETGTFRNAVKTATRRANQSGADWCCWTLQISRPWAL